jgi:glycosyltransferase involved in cell wall biosynthesis
MSKLSVCMIVKNEAKMLAQAINSLKNNYDELIVLDTGSTDSTKSVALSLGAKVFDYVWQQDFAHARNTAASYATHDNILPWDADWVLSDTSKKLFNKFKLNDFHNCDIAYFDWVNDFTDKLEVIRSEMHFFVYNKTTMKWSYPIHEELTTINTTYIPKLVEQPAIHVYHFKDKTKTERYSQNREMLLNVLQDKNLIGRARFRMLALLAQGYFFDQEYEYAYNAYTQALEADTSIPNDLTVFVVEKMFLCLLGQNLFDEAKQHLQNYKEVLQGDVRLSLMQADLLLLEGNTSESLTLYRKVIQHPQAKLLGKSDKSRYITHPYEMVSTILLQ